MVNDVLLAEPMALSCLDDHERVWALRALMATGLNQREAGKLLDISQSTVSQLLIQYDEERMPWEERATEEYKKIQAQLEDLRKSILREFTLLVLGRLASLE